MSLRTDLLPVFEDARQLMQDFGLRTHRVYRRIVDWSGAEVGTLTKTTTDTEILPRPKVTETADGYVISKITPTFSGGGYTMAYLMPTLDDSQQVQWVVVDPDGNSRVCVFAAGTDAVKTDGNFGYSIRVVHTDRTAPL